MFALTIGAYAIAKVVINPLAGLLYDRYGGKYLLIASLVIFSFSAYCFLTSDSTYSLIFTRIIQGVGLAILQPVLFSLVGGMAPKNRIASTLGRFDISFYVAGAIGPVIGGIVHDHFGFDGNILLFLFLSLTSLFLSLSCCKNYYEFNILKKERTTSQQSVFSFKMIALLFYVFGETFSTATLFIFMPIFLLNKVNMSSLKIGIVMSLSSLIMIILLIPMGRLADIKSKTTLAISGGLLFSLLVISIPFINSFYGAVLVFAGIGIFSAMSQPASGSLLVKEGHRIGMGKCSGVYKCAINSGFALAPFFGGFLLSKFSIESVFYFSGFVGLSTVLIFTLGYSEGKTAVLD